MDDSTLEHRNLGIVWMLLCLSLVLHVFDEATTGFLSVYNPTVLSLRASLGWWPMPTYAYRDWLTGLIVVCLVLLALSPFMFAGARWMRGMGLLPGRIDAPQCHRAHDVLNRGPDNA